MNTTQIHPLLRQLGALRWPLASKGVLVGKSASLGPGQEAELLRVDGDDELAAMIAIAISISTTGAVVSGDVIRPQATIQFGAGGATHQVVVDVAAGTIIAVPASSVRVVARNAGTQITYTMQASAALLPHAAPTSAQRTIAFGAVAGSATSSGQAVPTFFRGVRFYRTPPTADYTLQVLDSNSTVLYAVAVAASADSGYVVLSNDARSVRIVNGTTAIDESRFVFELAV